MPAPAQARARGLDALADLLPFAESGDPAQRLAARRMVRTIVADFHRAALPPGMRLIPARVSVSARGVHCEGGFFLGEREVTREEFRPFAARLGWSRPEWVEGDADLPATAVSLREARAFASAAGARLPTHDELAIAAGSGGRHRYPWGDAADPARANTREAGRGRLLPAGALSAGASAHGILDLLGNAAEWTETPAGRGYLCVVGGSYRSALRPVQGDAFRTYRLAETARLPDVGFRLARDLPELPPAFRAPERHGNGRDDTADSAPPEPAAPSPPPDAPVQAPPADGGS